MRKITGIIVHASATPANMDIGVKEIRQWHKAKGWKDIGYNYVIRRDGTLEGGRDLDNDGDFDEEVGAHAVGFNANTIGICLVGGTDADDKNKAEANFTFAQYRTLYSLVQYLKKQYNLTAKDIIGHRDLPGVTKACPCFDVQGFFS